MSPRRTSGLLRVFSTATAAMIGSGIFILPGIAFSMAGPGMIISYLSGGILAFVGVLSLIELITAMPKTGSGDYYYIQRSLGPLMGTISGFLGWMALSLKSAFAIFGLAEISFSLTGIDPRVTALITCALLAVLTVFSVRVQRLLQMVLGAVIITIILYYLINGVSVMRMDGLQSLFQGRSLHSSLMVTGFIFV